MSPEQESVYDPQLGKVIIRLKKNAPEVQQESEETDRCINLAEEILRQASTSHS
jgi:hypothetical protein